MTMFSAIYKGMTGLLGFSKSLDNLSTNVSNLNTPGFKGRDMFFRELGSGFDGAGDNNNPLIDSGVGQGVQVSGSFTRFSQGDVQATGTESDLAIEGEGFFILRDGDQQLYSRSGQFRPDDDGFLVDPTNGFRVAAISSSGGLVDINIQDNQTNPAVATTTAAIAASLSSSAATDTEVSADETLQIFSEQGNLENIGVNFVKETGRNWRVEFLDERNSPIANAHHIEYNGLGAPLIDTQSYQLSFESFEYLNESLIDEQLQVDQSVTVSNGDITTATPFIFSTENAQLIVREDQAINYVTQGNFSFTNTGFLLNDAGLRLAGRTADGVLEDINIAESLRIESQATTEVTLSGVIPASAAIGDSYPPLAEPALNFEVIDEAGAQKNLALRLEKTAANTWQITLTDDNGNVTQPTTQLNFVELTGVTDNSLAADRRVVDADVDFGNGDIFNLSLNFAGNDAAPGLIETQNATAALALNAVEVDGNVAGALESVIVAEQGTLQLSYNNGEVVTGQQLAVVERSGRPVNNIAIDFSATSSLSSVSDPSVSIQDSDGHANGQLISFSFENNGDLNFVYSNGETTTENKVALATVANKQNLVAIGSTLFKVKPGTEVIIGSPEEGAFGTLNGGSLELSNVELSSEFAEIIIVQRGFQASSQVLNASNEMIEELYNSVRGQ